MMPLGLLGTGEKAEVMEIRERNRGVKPAAACCGPDGNGWSCRMENMGLRTGKVVEMLNNEGAGAMLIKVDESRIAIGRGMAMKIMVRRQG
ncbi:MAG: ferrous iron transport protein A [Nitrospirae bacterium]|nr:ferrous iron transport protein A [Nitrospirota bacterium]